jgi:hypothetical protein
MTATVGFPLVTAAQLARQADEKRWLVESLWAEEAVGIVGGEPKCCKSFLALDMAVAVATGTPCLRRFAVPQSGPVLLYAAEDALHVVRQRLEGICYAAGTSIETLDVHVITVPTLRLDVEQDRRRLAETVCVLGPRLVILDPFVRLHRRDENVSGEVAPLLAQLRELQRMYSTAVLLVHHARKGGARLRAGQALRGSSEFHAWGDSNLYMRRAGDELTLSVEHRAAPSVSAIPLQLRAAGEALALHIDTRAPSDASLPPDPLSPAERIHAALAGAAGPMRLQDLRAACRIRNSTFRQQLTEMVAAGRVQRGPQGYELAEAAD